jgi:hypothetical protein
MLVRPLFEGPLDIVGDVHGEIDALHDLLFLRLGYDQAGRHPEGRRLVFVGDLGDRGPDSPGVVALVRRLIDAGQAQCVLGNHEMNALRQDTSKPELSWLFVESPAFRHRDRVIDQKRAGPERDSILRFFASLPVALERADLRVVHACWDGGMIERIRHERDVLEVWQRDAAEIDAWVDARPQLDAIDRKLIRQNRNPVKLLTSGPEVRSLGPVVINVKTRYEMRVPWWEWYGERVLCVFGHYWRGLLPGDDALHLFTAYDRAELLGPGNAYCVDLSAGKRFRERLRPEFADRYVTHLAALRLPERLLFLDNEEVAIPVVRPATPAGSSGR